jgi:hypothetical protein
MNGQSEFSFDHTKPVRVLYGARPAMRPGRIPRWDLFTQLRTVEAGKFSAEAELAIVAEERNLLVAELKRVKGELYRLWSAIPHY